VNLGATVFHFLENARDLLKRFRGKAAPPPDLCRLVPFGTPRGGVYDLGIVVPTVGIENRIVQRFLEAVANSLDADTGCLVCLVTDAPGHNSSKFNLAAARNTGLRRLLGSCKVVACADVDCLVPPGLVAWMARHVEDRHVWVPVRRLGEAESEPRCWSEWMSLPTLDYGLGGWNAMSPATWRRVGGWDQRCYGWGGEDNVLHERTRAAGIATVACREFPLVHVEHPPRAFGRPNRRRRANAKFSSRPQPNYLDGA
jgi:hypothetical protein